MPSEDSPKYYDQDYFATFAGSISAPSQAINPLLNTAASSSEIDHTNPTYSAGNPDAFNASSGLSGGPGDLPVADDSYLGFDLDADGEDLLEYDDNEALIGELPQESPQAEGGQLHEKRKSTGDKETVEAGGRKRRESEGRIAKKPGRKPLTAEPVTKRKAQNRAAQRAFRERKEKLLKDLKTENDDLAKQSESTNHENGILRAQVQRLEIELKAYQKRLSSTNNSGQVGVPPLASNAPAAASRNAANFGNNDFRFEFPQFGGPLPEPTTTALSGNGGYASMKGETPTRASTLRTTSSGFPSPGVFEPNSRSGPGSSASNPLPQTFASPSSSPANISNGTSAAGNNQTSTRDNSMDSFSGLFSPSILEASRQSTTYFPRNPGQSKPGSRQLSEQSVGNYSNVQHNNSSMSTVQSPASSQESPQACSSIGTSPEPGFNSPVQKCVDPILGTISEEYAQQDLGGTGITPGIESNDFKSFARSNGGKFDPLLINDYREPQNGIDDEDNFGLYFDEWFPLPELGSPGHTFSEIAPNLAKGNLMAKVDAIQVGVEGNIPNDDESKQMDCTNKIWDRVEEMPKLRKGSSDLDNLCTEFTRNARCSEREPGDCKEEADSNAPNTSQ